MKMFRTVFITVIAVFLVLMGILEFFLLYQPDRNDGYYRVEAKRLADELRETGTYDLSKYPHLTAVHTAADGPLYDTASHYFILEAAGTQYRVEYDPEPKNNLFWKVNAILVLMLLLLLALLLYFRKHIIIPFSRLNNVPRELAKGNLAVPIPEEKSRFFSKFTWGVNQLRETIEDSRKKEITMQRDKKLLLLSLSHDIKTPLSAIKLYAKALEKGLYPDEEKRRETAAKISSNVDQIEQFVSDLTRNASEDFMTVDVQNSEFYLGDLIESLREMYEEKFMIQQIPFEIADYRNCMLFGDAERAIEVMQNLLENVLKYCIGGKAQIRFATEEDCQLVTVTNTKCTLPESEAVHMFDSFWRGSNSSGRSGNGLGLFICRKLMQAMNGEIFAQITNGEMQVTAVFRRI